MISWLFVMKSTLFCLILLHFSFISICESSSDPHKALIDYLFLSNPNKNTSNIVSRELFGLFIKDSSTHCPNIQNANSSSVRCVQCQGLSTCNALNNYYIQEVFNTIIHRILAPTKILYTYY